MHSAESKIGEEASRWEVTRRPSGVGPRGMELDLSRPHLRVPSFARITKCIDASHASLFMSELKRSDDPGRVN